MHCIHGGKIVKTLPRRHTGKIVRPSADKNHASRRVADAKRLGCHPPMNRLRVLNERDSMSILAAGSS